jgi:hypothetical protein
MKTAQYVIDFAIIFSIVLFVSVIVTSLYGFFMHGSGAIDWETSVRLALILGIVLPWVHRRVDTPNAK